MMEQFRNNPAPPCPHCDEFQRELMDHRGEPPTPEAERDLRALRDMSTREERQEKFEYLAVELPSGRKRVEDMCKAELIEVCYLMCDYRDDEKKKHKRTLGLLGTLMDKLHEIQNKTRP
jgi:hypothetical protein